jgi:hypothetical protein
LESAGDNAKPDYRTGGQPRVFDCGSQIHDAGRHEPLIISILCQFLFDADGLIFQRLTNTAHRVIFHTHRLFEQGDVAPWTHAAV